MKSQKVGFHPNFIKDIKKFKKKEQDIILKKINEIKENPERKRLHYTNNCYSVRFKNFRIIYYYHKKEVWFLTVEKRKKVYDSYLKRLKEMIKNFK